MNLFWSPSSGEKNRFHYWLGQRFSVIRVKDDYELLEGLSHWMLCNESFETQRFCSVIPKNGTEKYHENIFWKLACSLRYCKRSSFIRLSCMYFLLSCDITRHRILFLLNFSRCFCYLFHIETGSSSERFGRWKGFTPLFLLTRHQDTSRRKLKYPLEYLHDVK